MTIRYQRRLCWIIAALLGLATVYVWGKSIHSLATPLDPTTSETSEDTTGAATPLHTTTKTDQSPPLNSFRTLWSQPLRQALYDPPPPPPAPAAPPPPLRIKLLGTVLEPGRSEAIVMDSAGVTHMLRKGAAIEDASVQTIEDTHITVLYHNQLLTLTPPGSNPRN